MTSETQYEQAMLSLENFRCGVPMCKSHIDSCLLAHTSVCEKHRCEEYRGCLHASGHRGGHKILATVVVKHQDFTLLQLLERGWRILSRDVLDDSSHKIKLVRYGVDGSLVRFASSIEDIMFVNRTLSDQTSRFDSFSPSQLADDGWKFQIHDEALGWWIKDGYLPQLRKNDESLDSL